MPQEYLTGVDPANAVDQLLTGHRAADVIDELVLACAAATYGKSRRPPPALAAEYIVFRVLLANRTARGSEAPLALDELVRAAEALGSFGLAGASPGSVPAHEADPQMRMFQHQGFAYDPAIPELESQRWAPLFGPFAPAFEEQAGIPLDGMEQLVAAFFRQELGFSMQAFGAKVSGTRIDDLLHALAESIDRLGQVARPADLTLGVAPSELSAACSLSIEQVEAGLRLLAARPSKLAGRSFARAVWELRNRPIVEIDGLLFAPIVANLAFALRPAVERVLRTTSQQDRYNAHKARWLEDYAMERLVQLATADQAHRALRIGTRSDEPERDGLVRTDSVALAVEIKGGGIPAAARGGERSSQDKVLERLVRHAARQADSLIAALRVGETVSGVRLADGVREPVDLGLVDVWIPIVITLEDLSGPVAIGPQIFDNRDAEAPYPIVLTLDDLEWFARELPLVSQFFHYLAVRQGIARADSSIVVFDEADWFRIYCGAGGAGVRKIVETPAEIDIPILIVGSDYRRGVPDPRAPRWCSPFHRSLERWQEERRDGWLEASMAVLDLRDEVSLELVDSINGVAEHVLESGEWDSLSHRLESGGRAIHLFVARDTMPDGEDTLPAIYALYPDVREHILIGIDARRPDELVYQTFVGFFPPDTEGAQP